MSEYSKVKEKLPNSLFFDEFRDALIGTSVNTVCSGEEAVYDFYRVLSIIQDNRGVGLEESFDIFHNEYADKCFGKVTPIFVKLRIDGGY